MVTFYLILGILFPLTPLLLAIPYFRVLKNSTNITYDLQMGLRCYQCKEEIPEDPEVTLEKARAFHTFASSVVSVNNTTGIKNFASEYQKKFAHICLCKSCKRDKKLDSLVGSKVNLILDKIRRFYVSGNTKTLDISLIIILVIALGIDVIFLAKGLHGGTIITNISNCLFWANSMIKAKLNSIKKVKV
jgi:hypothetical protein